MESKQTIGGLIVTLGVFSFLIAMLAVSFIIVMEGTTPSGLTKFFVQYHIHLMVLLGILGIVVGILSYYTINKQQKDVQASHKTSKDILLQFLDETETTIINYLLEDHKRPVTQSHISQLKDIGKVKSFRTLQRLQQKNLITLEAYGKTNRVYLQEHIKEILYN